MTEKRAIGDRSHDGSGFSNADQAIGNETQEIDREDHPYVDPAEEVMNSNPNISPPIHPKAD